MATEKFFVFNEAGTLKRLKGRIVRFLDNEDPSGSDKSAIRTSLEVSPDAAGLVQADVGTDPQNLVLHGHLGDLAYQSADSVAVAELQVESTTGTATTQALTVTDGSTTGLVVQEDGKVSVRGKVSLNVDGSASWGSAEDYGKLTWDTGKAIVRGESGKSLSLGSNGTQDHLIVDTSGNVGIGTPSPDFTLDVAGDIGVDYKIYHNDDHDTFLAFTGDTFTVRTGGTDRLTVNNSAIQMGTGMGIDFGSAAAAGRTVESGLLDDYERGQWSPRFEMTGANFATVTMEVVAAHYVKIGRFVHCQAEIRTDNIDATGASGSVAIQGLPFTSESTSGNSSSLSVGYGAAWVTAPASGYVPANSTYAVLTRYTTTGTSTLSASDLTAGATADRNQLNFSVSYVTAS